MRSFSVLAKVRILTNQSAGSKNQAGAVGLCELVCKEYDHLNAINSLDKAFGAVVQENNQVVSVNKHVLNELE